MDGSWHNLLNGTAYEPQRVSEFRETLFGSRLYEFVCWVIMMISACGVSSWAMAHSASSVIHTVHISVPYNSFLAPSIAPSMDACMLIYYCHTASSKEHSRQPWWFNTLIMHRGFCAIVLHLYYFIHNSKGSYRGYKWCFSMHMHMQNIIETDWRSGENLNKH